MNSGDTVASTDNHNTVGSAQEYVVSVYVSKKEPICGR